MIKLNLAIIKERFDNNLTYACRVYINMTVSHKQYKESP